MSVKTHNEIDTPKGSDKAAPSDHSHLSSLLTGGNTAEARAAQLAHASQGFQRGGDVGHIELGGHSELYGNYPADKPHLPEGEQPGQSNNSTTVEVKHGDSLWKIAKNHLGDHSTEGEVKQFVQGIAKLNDMPDPFRPEQGTHKSDVLHPGQHLRLPGDSHRSDAGQQGVGEGKVESETGQKIEFKPDPNTGLRLKLAPEAPPESKTNAATQPAAPSDVPPAPSKDLPEAANRDVPPPEHEVPAPVQPSANNATAPAPEQTEAPTPEKHWYSGAMAVAGDVLHGAENEVINHPGRVAGAAVIGVASVLAAPVIVAGAAAVGVSAAVVEGAVLVGGAAYTGYQAYEHGGAVLHDANVVANPQGFSAQEQAKAHAGLNNVGAAGTDFVAGATGGLAAGLVKGALTSGADSVLSGARGGGPPPLEAPLSGPPHVEPPLSGPPPLEAPPSGPPHVETPPAGTHDTALTTAKPSEIGQTKDAANVAEKSSASTHNLGDGQLQITGDSHASSAHVDVRPGSETYPDGSTKDVFFHSEEMKMGKLSPEATAARLQNEQGSAKLNKIIGFNDSYPESQAATAVVNGKAETGWIQEAVGKPLESLLKERAQTEFGTTSRMNEDVAKILDSDPALRSKVEDAVVERIVYGDKDIGAKNIGVSADGSGTSVRNFDMGEAFSTDVVDHAPSLSSYQNSLTTLGLQNSMSGRAISPEMTRKLSEFVGEFGDVTGAERLSQSTGLSAEQTAGVIARTRLLVFDGKLPTVDPSLNDADNIAFLRSLDQVRAKQ
jgi:LysM repeat protein